MKNQNWTSICTEDDLIPDSGLCALFENEQVAIFKFSNHDRIFAVSNYDPIGEANVISRGIIGSVDGRFVVSSPLYKQHYCLETGECLEEDASIRSYPIRSHKGEIQIGNLQ